MSRDEDERVRVYDEHGEPYDEVLRTKSGRVLTEAALNAMAEVEAEAAVNEVHQAFDHLRGLEDAYRQQFPDGRLGPPREEEPD